MTEQEVQELYMRCTHSIPGTETVRAIDFSWFETAVEIISSRAYKEGVIAGCDAMDNAVQSALNLIDV